MQIDNKKIVEPKFEHNLAVVTINYNNGEGLRRTLDSVANQIRRDEIQHVIIDGRSQDQSKNIIEQYANTYPNVSWISEKDGGIYFAMNKGLKLVNAKYVSFLNSGDVLHSSDILQCLLRAIDTHPEIDIIYGDLIIGNDGDYLERKWRTGCFARWKLLYGWMPPHPMTALRLADMLRLGGFDTRLKIAADYKILLYAFTCSNVRAKYVNRALVCMEKGGTSNASVGNILRANLEVLKAWQHRFTYFYPLWLLITKPISKLFQYRRGKS